MRTKLQCTTLLVAALAVPPVAYGQAADASPFPPSGFTRGVSFEHRAVVGSRSGWAVNWERTQTIAGLEPGATGTFPASGHAYDVSYHQRFPVRASTGSLPDGCPAPRGGIPIGGPGGGKDAIVLLPLVIVAAGVAVIVAAAAAINQARCARK